MNIGMLGTGTIATRLSETFVKMDGGIVAYAIASNPEKCRQFVEKYGWKKRYETYEELMRDPEVDIAYITVPNPFHYELCKMAFKYNKNVICEKPFCVNEKQLKEIFELAEEKHLFITEALWTNYMPSKDLIDEVISSGLVGKITKAEIYLKNNVSHLARIKDPELAGGALLDLGPYTFGMMTTHFGCDIKSINAEFTYFETGVDSGEVIDVDYTDGLKVRIENNVNSEEGVRFCLFHGAEGKILIEGTNNPKAIKIYDLADRLIKEVPIPQQITGYEYQFLACERCLKAHELECREIPHKQSLFIAHLTDELRNMAGVRFPCE